MREGGPEHCRGRLESYMERLKETGRAYGIPLLEKQYSSEWKHRKEEEKTDESNTAAEKG